MTSRDLDVGNRASDVASGRRRLDRAGSWTGSGPSGSRGAGGGILGRSAPVRVANPQLPGGSIRDDPRFTSLEQLFAAQDAEGSAIRLPAALRGRPRPGTYSVPRFCGDYGFKQCLNCLRWLCAGSRKLVGWREGVGGYIHLWYRCLEWDMECEWTDGFYSPHWRRKESSVTNDRRKAREERALIKPQAAGGPKRGGKEGE